MDVLCPSREEGGSCWRWRYAAGVERAVEGGGGGGGGGISEVVVVVVVGVADVVWMCVVVRRWRWSWQMQAAR